MQTIPTITSRDELESYMDWTYVRWSQGPERDAENGWMSRNWAPPSYEIVTNDDGEDVEVNIGGGYDEIGLSVTLFTDDKSIREWAADANCTDVCYLLTGRRIGECSDGYPLIDTCQPLAIVAPELIASL